MNRYTLGLYEKALPASLSWVEKLLAAKTAGFDFLEMSIDETDEKLWRLDMSEGEIGLIVAAVQSVGLPIRSLCLSGHRKYSLGCSDKAKQQRSLEIMDKAIRLSALLGVRVIQLAGYDVYYEDSTAETRADFLKNLRICAEMAARNGILLGFETMETPFMDNVKKAMNYVTQVNSPYLGVYPDSGNITNAALLYKDDVAVDLLTGSGHIVAVHLKESLPGKYREIPFGQGHVDFDQIISCAWKLGVRRYVTEMWHTGQADWQDEIKKAEMFMRSHFAKVIKDI